MTNDSTPNETTEHSEKLSIGGKIILALCVLGVIAALVLALDSSGIALFDGHAAEVLSHFWNRTATIGLIVALVVSVAVGIFVIFLAKATLFSDSDADLPELGTH